MVAEAKKVLLILLSILVMLAACSESQATVTSTPSAMPTPATTAPASGTPTRTPGASPTPTAVLATASAEGTTAPPATATPCLTCDAATATMAARRLATSTPASDAVLPTPQIDLCGISVDPTTLRPPDAVFSVSTADSRPVLTWASNESTLAVAGAGGVWLYDPTTNAEPTKLPVSAAELVTSLAFSPDGARLAAGTRSGTIMLWNLSDSGSPRALDDHEAPVWSLAFHPTGHTLASGGGRNRPGVSVTPAEGFEDTAVRLWNVATGELRTRLTHDHGMVYQVTFSPDGTVLAAGTSDVLSGRSMGQGAIVRWRPETGQSLPTLPAGGAIAFDPAGATAVTMNHVFEPERIWDLATGDERAQIPGVGQWAYDLALRFDAGVVAAALGDYGLGSTWAQTWTADGTAMAALPAGAPIALSPDGQWLASGNGPTANCGSGFRYEPIDHVVRVYAAAGGDPVARLATGDVESVDVAFSGDGQWLAEVSLDGAVRLWQAATWSSPPAASDLAP